MQSLSIPAELFHAMVAHAQREFPAECCGLLAGVSASATHWYPLRNELASPIAYRADAHDLFTVHRDMRHLGLEIVAIYHSHPATEARPSRHDLAENYYGEVPRIIISLAEAQPVVRAFILYEDNFREIDCGPIE
jgi:proteasome lid subunit RPN8/RPN11